MYLPTWASGVMTRPRCPLLLVLRVVLLAMLVLVSACQVNPRAQPAPKNEPDPNLITGEPRGVAAFLAALAFSDEETAEDVASPLYRAEWERRGLNLAERRSFHADVPAWSVFAFAGGVVGDGGFGHFLYLATPRPRGHLQTISPSVWRVDTDPDGWAIWAEMVYRFSSGAAPTTTATAVNESDSSIPAAFRALHPSLVVRIQSDASPESYTALRLGRLDGALPTAVDRDGVAFWGLDDEGQVRPAAWSYGQTRTASAAKPDPAVDELRLAYLASLSR